MTILPTNGFSLFALALVLCLNSINLFPLTKAFSIDLIHRDSLKSPLHNPSISYYSKLNKAFGRSLSRASHLKKYAAAASSSSHTNSLESYVDFQGGEYIMNISIGSYPVVMIGIVDTASDLTWTQCSPCPHCYDQNIPLFNPQNTSTYKRLSCKSTQCQSLASGSCDNSGQCKYDLAYGDSSYSNGDLATESFTFQSSTSTGSEITFPEVAFGCSTSTGGHFHESASGIVGLGGGQLSIVNQLSVYTQGKFSFCLVPYYSDLTSKFYFGKNDLLLSSSNVLSTPLFYTNPITQYYIKLEGISVGDSEDEIGNSTFDSKDEDEKLIIDTGTTVTFLPTKLYNDLETTLISSIYGNRTSDPENILSLCYEREGDDYPVFPEIVFHFTDADMKLPAENTFVEVADGMMCLEMAPSNDTFILGNISLMNFVMEIDLENNMVNFLPTDCSKDNC